MGVAKAADVPYAQVGFSDSLRVSEEDDERTARSGADPIIRSRRRTLLMVVTSEKHLYHGQSREHQASPCEEKV